MRTIGSPTLLRDRAKRRATRSILLVVGGVLLLVAGFAVAQMPGGAGFAGGTAAMLGFGAFVVAWMLASAAQRDARDAILEAPLVTQLQARLSDDYLYLRRVTLPGQNVEADGVLLGPHGVLVLALHAVTGRVRVRGDDWFMVEDGTTSGQPVRLSPSWALARRLRTVQRMLREEDLGTLPVHGAVVLVDGQLLDADRPAVAVVPLNRIASYVEYLRSEDADALRDRVSRVADLLTPPGPATAEPQRR